MVSDTWALQLISHTQEAEYPVSKIQTSIVSTIHVEFVSGLLWLGLDCQKGGAGGFLMQCTNSHTHTRTQVASLAWGCWRFGWEHGGCGLPSDTAGGCGDACPLTYRPRETFTKKFLICPAGPCFYVCAPALSCPFLHFCVIHTSPVLPHIAYLTKSHINCFNCCG